MATITIEQAQATLSEIVHRLAPGDEVVITENNLPVATLVAHKNLATNIPRRLGTLAGTVTYIAADFDAPLDDFKEYME